MSRINLKTLRAQAEAIAVDEPDVRLVYLFGSQIEGDIGPLSDVDLAVLLAHDSPIYACRSRLAQSFSELLEYAPVDLIMLNQASIEMAYAIIAEGVPLFERSRAERIEYEADVLGRYGDFLPFLRVQREAILEGKGDDRRVQRYREAAGRNWRAPGATGTTAPKVEG